MKIIYLDALKGYSYWFYNKKKLISLKLDLEDLEENPTVHPKLCSNLKKLLPSLYAHFCLKSFNKIFEGNKNIDLIHLIGHIAVELQNLAGMKSSFEKELRTRERGVYRVFFSYEMEEAGLYAAEAAVQIVQCLGQGRKYMDLKKDINRLRHIYNIGKLGPSTKAIVDEAEKRGIPWSNLDNQSIITLGYGVYQKKIWMTVTSHTPSIGVEIAGDKNLTKTLLKAHLIPTPEGQLIKSLDELDKVLDSMPFPLTTKPLDGNHGRGVSCNIQNKSQAEKGFHLAKKFSNQVIVEHFIAGKDYRFLVIDFKVVAVAHRSPAQIIGTGTKTIEELINETNQDPKRGQDHDNFLTRIEIDELTKSLIHEKNLRLDSILPESEVLILKHSANISSGGTATDVTDSVHPFNINYAERIAKIMNLDICGIDAIIEDIEVPMNRGNCSILEVNAAPGLRMHLDPSCGKARNVAAFIVDSLFPQDKPFKVPIIAVTGTNGKTTIVRLIAQLASFCNFKVGFTSTEGIYIDNELVHQGDCSGPVSARVVLLDPSVDFAVLECARGGILREGLAFDSCDISIISNITGDHLGLEDVHTLEELTRVKALIAHRTKKDGYAILNAQDDLVYELRKELTCKIALFGLKKEKRILNHCRKGGLAAFIQQGWLVVCKDKKEQAIIPIHDIPLAFEGSAELMIKNILAAVLVAFIQGFPLEKLKKALKGFHASEQLTPGRMNLYRFKQFNLMLDYVHNEGGFLEIKKFIDSLDCARKIGIISAVGDRRLKDIQKIGSLSAQMFDEIIIKHNKDSRGRSNETLSSWLLEGIYSEKADSKVKIISNEFDAIDYAIARAIPNTFIFYAVDDVFLAIDYIKNKIKTQRM